MAEDAASAAYRALPTVERVRLFFTGFYPYLFLLLFTEMGRSFSILSDVINGNFSFWAIRVFQRRMLIQWEIPRLCRGGSRSLTFPGVVPGLQNSIGRRNSGTYRQVTRSCTRCL